MPLYQPGGAAVTIKDEGGALATAASSLDFVGTGVTASGTGADKTITIPGGSNQRASIAAASAAIANTETVVVSTSLAANYLTAGMSFRIRAAGVGTTGAAAGADTFRIRIGTTTLTGNIPTSVAPTANNSVTAQPFSFEALVTVRTTGATGTIIGECQALGDNATTGLFTTLNDLSATTATVVVDTTATNLLELTFQSGSAGSSCTFHAATIEVLSSGSVGDSLGAWTSFTPTWTTDGSAPTLGNGTVTGQYKRLDATAYLVIINFVFGSTSAVGTGNFRFALPFTAGASFEQTFAGRLLDNGTAHFVAAGLISAGNAFANVAVADATGVRLAGAGVPITWATGDQINLHGILYV